MEGCMVAPKLGLANAGVSNESLKHYREKLAPELARLRTVVQSRAWGDGAASLLLSDEKKILQETDAAARNFKHATALVVVGMGGPGLASQAVHAALQPRNAKCDLLFAGTVDADSLKPIAARVEADENAVINLATQSGATTESLANFRVLLSKIPRKQWRERIVITTNK
ncbi:MAG: hypothetical protein AABW54_04405, partial [Candidatus Micrarchaeota archaeon]